MNASRNATEDLQSYKYYKGMSRILNVNDNGQAGWYYLLDSFDVAELVKYLNSSFWYPADALAKASSQP